MDEKTYNKKLRGMGWRVFALSFLLVGALVVFQLVGFIIVLLLDIPDESLWATIIPEAFGAAGAVGSVALMGGGSWVTPSLKDVRHTFRFGWWCLAVSVGLMIYDIIYYVSTQTPIASNWPILLVQNALFCLFVGIYEEFVFRGLVFNGLLALLGDLKRGVGAAVLITSLAFGLAHVDLQADLVDGLSVLQAVLKTIQTGMYSVLLCTIVLHTRKLGGVSLFHGFDDFLLLLPSLVLFGEPLELDYVAEGEDAWPAILNYLMVIALYVPFVIKSVRELRRKQYVSRGVFMEKRMARLQRRYTLPVAGTDAMAAGMGGIAVGGLGDVPPVPQAFDGAAFASQGSGGGDPVRRDVSQVSAGADSVQRDVSQSSATTDVVQHEGDVRPTPIGPPHFPVQTQPDASTQGDHRASGAPPVPKGL